MQSNSLCSVGTYVCMQMHRKKFGRIYTKQSNVSLWWEDRVEDRGAGGHRQGLQVNCTTPGVQGQCEFVQHCGSDQGKHIIFAIKINFFYK